MSLTRRLEKLHRMRAALEPPRSWMARSGGGLPMTIRRHSDFEDRQLMLFGTATIVLLVIAWTFAYLASRAV